MNEVNAVSWIHVLSDDLSVDNKPKIVWPALKQYFFSCVLGRNRITHAVDADQTVRITNPSRLKYNVVFRNWL